MRGRRGDHRHDVGVIELSEQPNLALESILGLFVRRRQETFFREMLAITVAFTLVHLGVPASANLLKKWPTLLCALSLFLASF